MWGFRTSDMSVVIIDIAGSDIITSWLCCDWHLSHIANWAQCFSSKTISWEAVWNIKLYYSFDLRCLCIQGVTTLAMLNLKECCVKNNEELSLHNSLWNFWIDDFYGWNNHSFYLLKTNSKVNQVNYEFELV